MMSNKNTKDMSLVEANGVGVIRNNRWLLRDVDIAIHRSSIVSLIGPNGSGKTTVAKILTDVIKPDRGSVNRQQDLTIGYVPQRFNLNSTFPITVNRLMNLTRKHSNRAVAEALDSLQISHLAQTAVQNLSGGEFQRALFARAIVSKPDLLILDEPAQGMDYAGEASLYQLVEETRNRFACGILLITHDLHIVMAKADVVICLNTHVCCTGTPDVVANNKEYTRLFGETAQKSLALYHHEHDHEHLPDGSIATSAKD